MTTDPNPPKVAEQRDRIVYTRVPPDLFARLLDKAKYEANPVSALVRRAIREWLDRQDAA